MDDLEQFLTWWMQTRAFNIPQTVKPVFQKDTVGTVLYQNGEHQVEMFVLSPNSEIVPHIHPNVDSFEVYMSGDIKFMCNDEWYEPKDAGITIRVKPNSWHGGLFGERGGCFLSVQKWLNGVKPKFVGDDWVDKNNGISYGNSGN